MQNFWKIGQDLTKLQKFKDGNFFETQCHCEPKKTHQNVF